MPIGVGHWWVILLVLLIVLIMYGPGKIPDVGSAMGKAIREFRKASSDLREQVLAGQPSEKSEPDNTGDLESLPTTTAPGAEKTEMPAAKGRLREDS